MLSFVASVQHLGLYTRLWKSRKDVIMKKQHGILLCLLLVIFAIMLQGCTNDPVDPIDTSADPGVVTPAVQDLSVVADGASVYSVIIREGASDAVTDMARLVRKTIQEATGVQLEWNDDFIERGGTAPAKEIVIGITNREESISARQDLAYGEYAIRVMGEKIIIAAWDELSLRAGCEAFCSLVQENTVEGQFTLKQDYAVTDVGFAALKDMPHYGESDEVVQFVDLDDDCYMLYASDTDEAEFKAYAGVLEGAGYTQFASRQFGNNLHMIYTSEDKVIHASYVAKDKDARISIEDAYDMSIFTAGEYEKICEPSVSLVGLECYGKDSKTGVFNQIGLCMIFRLEDGRFIIVDGGGYTQDTAGLVYSNLRKLAVDKNNITVAAWILTHAHGDHTGGFLKFTEAKYHTRVTIQNIIHHFSTPEQYDGIEEGADSGRSEQARKTFINEYPNATIIKAHTGQLIQAGGVEIEMLYTYEDLEPSPLEYHNTTSLVFRVTAQDTSVMVLGDASNRVSLRLVAVYGDYLQSDMVQIAHHGYTGGTIALYEAIDADVVLWPGGVDSFDGNKGLEAIKFRGYNAKALELAEEAYVAGRAVYTLTLPYTPEDVEETKVIK